MIEVLSSIIRSPRAMTTNLPTLRLPPRCLDYPESFNFHRPPRMASTTYSSGEVEEANAILIAMTQLPEAEAEAGDSRRRGLYSQSGAEDTWWELPRAERVLISCP